jgi:hypothetical protein
MNYSKTIAALYVIKDGPYFGIPGVEPFDESRDARKYKGPHRVIAHPPCQRWGRYWGGGPMLHGTAKQKLLGDDDGCFAHALWAVRTFGGVLEHPEASHAWKFYGLNRPKLSGWWKADSYGGWTTCVAQGNYGHRARKLTWLYTNKIELQNLDWSPCRGKDRLDEGFHSKEERSKTAKTGRHQRLKVREQLETPAAFRDLLIEMVRS